MKAFITGVSLFLSGGVAGIGYKKYHEDFNNGCLGRNVDVIYLEDRKDEKGNITSIDMKQIKIHEASKLIIENPHILHSFPPNYNEIIKTNNNNNNSNIKQLNSFRGEIVTRDFEAPTRYFFRGRDLYGNPLYGPQWEYIKFASSPSSYEPLIPPSYFPFS